ncbi:MAG: hypothetical protein JWO19_5855 [Bryobacterales bacterium]|nr:hypothetical protein [Bryobacterales bacterium]
MRPGGRLKPMECEDISDEKVELYALHKLRALPDEVIAHL